MNVRHDLRGEIEVAASLRPMHRDGDRQRSSQTFAVLHFPVAKARTDPDALFLKIDRPGSQANTTRTISYQGLLLALSIILFVREGEETRALQS